MDPARKIRDLEDSLAIARRYIQDLQSQLPKDIIDQARQSARSQSNLDAPQYAHAGETSSANIPTTTGLGLIEALLRSLSHHHSDIANLTRSMKKDEFLRSSTSVTKCFYTTLCQLPPEATMVETVNAAFNGIFGLCNIVAEQDFYTSAQALYESHPMSYTQEHAIFVPVFFSVLSLGSICRTGSDQESERKDDSNER